MATRRQEAPQKKVTEGIGGRIREARKLLGITQESLSDRSGHSKSQIAQWEIGTRTPGIDGAFSLATSMGISFVWLATGQGDLQSAYQEKREPRHSSSLFKSSVGFAQQYMANKDLTGVLDLAELAEKLYDMGANAGFDAQGKNMEECADFLRKAANIQVEANVTRSPRE